MAAALRLLIVDDDAGHREICRRFLARYFESECEVVEAASGSQGLVLCRTRLPDCVLLDYHLPDVDGVTFLRALGAGNHRVPVPVIMITGGGNDALVAAARQAGAVDYLSKRTLSTTRLGRAVVDAIATYSQRIVV